MRLMRIGQVCSERPVILTAEGRYFDLSDVTDDVDPRSSRAVALIG